jgi:hypothetical protein
LNFLKAELQNPLGVSVFSDFGKTIRFLGKDMIAIASIWASLPTVHVYQSNSSGSYNKIQELTNGYIFSGKLKIQSTNA